MKNEDKKVPDAPKRLWVQTNSLIHDSGLESSVATSMVLTMLIHTMPQMMILRRNGGTELLLKHTRCLAVNFTSIGTAILSFSFTISN